MLSNTVSTALAPVSSVLAPAVEIVSRWARACDLDVERAVHLARQVFIEPVDWVEEMAEALHSGAQWILDMGPGEALTRLNRSVVRGQGVGVVAAATRGGLRNLFTPGATPPIERPWKAPSIAISFVRPVRRVSLNAASLASVPELAKNTVEPPGA